MKCPEEIIEMMHQFLDDELDQEKEITLREHLQNCKECQALFNEFTKTIALVKSTSNIQAPENFTECVRRGRSRPPPVATARRAGFAAARGSTPYSRRPGRPAYP